MGLLLVIERQTTKISLNTSEAGSRQNYQMTKDRKDFLKKDKEIAEKLKELFEPVFTVEDSGLATESEHLFFQELKQIKAMRDKIQ